MQITGLILVANLIDQPQEVDKINYGVSIHFEMLQENNDTKTYSQCIICKVYWTYM